MMNTTITTTNITSTKSGLSHGEKNFHAVAQVNRKRRMEDIHRGLYKDNIGSGFRGKEKKMEATMKGLYL